MEPPINTINNNCSTPYIGAPSSPQRSHNFYFSAPASPLHISCSSSSSIIAFEDFDDEEEEGYEFEFSGQLDTISRSSLSTADQLFDGGKIRPLKPPSQVTNGSNTPNSHLVQNKDELFSKHEEEIPLKFNDHNRGRSKNISPSRSNSRKGLSRSLSPLRVSEFALLQEQEQEQENMKDLSRNSIKNGGSLSFRWGSNKWRLKDFLLFRSASEGRASSRGKDPLKKYFSLVSSKKNDEESKGFGSFRSIGLCSSSMADGSVSRRRGQGHVSAHEVHYMENRAVTGELKKKTSLPYKHGLLGCLGLNPAFHGIFARS